MVRRVKYNTYLVLKVLYKVTVITASDNEAVICIRK